MVHSPRPSQHTINEAVQARNALAAALIRAGIQLPAMDVRTPWNSDLNEYRDGEGDGGRDDAGRACRYALVHLGVCSAPVAHALAEVIAKGAAR